MERILVVQTVARPRSSPHPPFNAQDHFIKTMAPGNRPKKGKTGGKAKGGPVTYTAEMLVEQGNVALANMQLELAEQFFGRALSMSPSNTNIMDALADVQIQLGESCKAMELLVQSTSMAPKENPYKWFFLGQLQQELDAVKSYQTGIQVLVELLPTLPSVRRACTGNLLDVNSLKRIYRDYRMKRGVPHLSK